MEIFYGEDLKGFVKARLRNINRKRYCYSDLKNFIEGNDYTRVCCLYGLRRTGKTTMMCQAIDDFLGYEKTLFVTCEVNDTVQNLKETLKEHKDLKYVFVDETTRMSDFIKSSSVFADVFTGLGWRIVMSGTDSLGFVFAKADALYDRMKMIHTSYISFKEYNYLLGKDLMSFIEYGGTLTDGEQIYNTKDNVNEYTNTAIVENITHSIKYLGEKMRYTGLKRLYDNDELISAINRVIENNNHKFVLDTINNSFKSHDIGSANDLLRKRGMEEIVPDENLMAMLRSYLGVKEEHLTQLDEQDVDAIIKYLIDLDVLYKLKWTKDEYIFVQPGMRYSQYEALKDTYMQEQQDKSNIGTKADVIKIIEGDIKGRILEDIILLELSIDNDIKYDISKYRNQDNREVDTVIADLDNEEMVLAEIKLSDKRHSNQLKNLENKDFIEDIKKKYGCKIKQNVCLYMGESGYNEKHNVIYLNAEEFLKDKKQYTEELFSGKLCETLNKVEVEEPEMKKQPSRRGR